MNYAETLGYLYTRLPMFSKLGAGAIKKDLHNIRALGAASGNLHTKLKFIHVAGTNGKGSTSHMLAAILQTAGYKTGLYTSPHLKDFRERIRINGQMIPEQKVVELTQKFIPLIDELEPSFFEITVAMAFDWMAEEQVDIAVFETGLGGRLDSTNIITPEVSVITNIGWDHMALLGNTLAEIAAEKAGIIKKHIPVVVGEILPETKPVFEQKALVEEAPIFYAPNELELVEWQGNPHHLEVTVKQRHAVDAHHYTLDLPGVYQTKNVLTVLQTVAILQQRGYNIKQEAIQQGLSQVKKLTGLHGRWELIQEHPSIVLDVAHNKEGIEAVLKQLELCTYSNLHIVIGMVKDKDVHAVLRMLPSQATYYFTQAQLPRALAAADLQQMAAPLGLNGDVYATVNEAVNHAKISASKQDLILVCGSVFVVGELNW